MGAWNPVKEVPETKNNIGYKIHLWNDLEISYQNLYVSNAVFIKGAIPLEVASRLYEKCKEYNNDYGIFFNRFLHSVDPRKCAVDEKYCFDYEVVSGLSENKIEDYNKIKRNLMRRKDDSKYLQECYIESQDGLISFLAEMKDFYLRRCGKPETEVARINEYKNLIGKEKLKGINYSTTTEEWMNGSKESKNYSKCVNDSIKTEMEKKLRVALNDFDDVICSCLDNIIGLSIYEHPFRNIEIFIKKNDYDGAGNYQLIIRMLKDEKENKISFERQFDGFKYKTSCNFSDGQHLTVEHNYNNYYNGNNSGEYVKVWHVNQWGKTVADFNFNIGTGIVIDKYNNKAPITEEQFNYILEMILNATMDVNSVADIIKKGRNRVAVKVR